MARLWVNKARWKHSDPKFMDVSIFLCTLSRPGTDWNTQNQT